MLNFSWLLDNLLVQIIIPYLLVIICILISVAFITVFERQVLGAVQRRQGPNLVGFYGLFQALADGLKLLLKESIAPKSSDFWIFSFAPIFTFTLALSGWIVIPFGNGMAFTDFTFGLLFLFALSSFGVHSVIMAGWSSNSKYAFLGGLRSAAQMISYEIPMGTTLLSVILIAGTLNFSDIVENQYYVWFCIPLFPTFLLFFITTLAETNRHPFDLPEAEAELVSGYNVEYSAMGFALFFLAEYSNIILMCAITVILFAGGWLEFISFLSFIPAPFFFSIKTFFFIFLFIIIRGVVPRVRWDQLMRLGWKVFLPVALAFVFLYASLLISFNLLGDLIR